MIKKHDHDFIFKTSEIKEDDPILSRLNYIKFSEFETTMESPTCLKHQIDFVKKIKDNKEYFVCHLCNDQKKGK